ncbi:hypothetical protein [Herbaspirillum chlorophenolicum]|uniref:hypothetical protein n=1 Tax=Herbaspirillum chlorophenolicum TaxID=211589 RepID=UPI0012E31283|nr:hypothetical protein [Herbaspirillum chlorophenolicum]
MIEKIQTVIIEPRREIESAKTGTAAGDCKQIKASALGSTLQARVHHAFGGMTEQGVKVAIRGSDHRLSKVSVELRVSHPDSWSKLVRLGALD